MNAPRDTATAWAKVGKTWVPGATWTELGTQNFLRNITQLCSARGPKQEAQHPEAGAPGHPLSRDCLTTRAPQEPHTAQSTEKLPLCRRSTILCFAEKALLDGKKDHLLNQARAELMKQEHQVGPLNNCIEELQQQAHAQRLADFFESRREQSRLQTELSMKEKLLRETHIRNFHEMGEMKRAQELRVDEFSVQKLRECHETIQRLTSQMQEMQEQMNSMNHSGEFQ